jgi:fumarylacetoacetase
VKRPRGQLKPPNAELPSFGPCKRLDFELEMGVVIGQPSVMGEMLSEKQAEEMIFGFVLLNDWSARDIQQWEYVPLGPFQAKAFATSISPWVVTREALEPFCVPGPVQDPVPLPYLQQTQPHNYDLELEVSLRAAPMNAAASICRTNFKYMYWSSVQQLVHHASSGCAMNVGDLLGSGTISGPEKAQRGSLLEISWNGSEPVELPGGIKRTFLEDGDSLVMRGWCQGDGFRVGFGEVEGTVVAAEG